MCYHHHPFPAGMRKNHKCESARDLYGGRLPLKPDITKKKPHKTKKKKKSLTKEYRDEKQL